MENYTRKIDREYNKLLLKDSKTTAGADGRPSIEINPSNIQDANDFLICSLFGLSQDEVDNLGIDEYEMKLVEANEKRDFLLEKAGSKATKKQSDQGEK